MRRDKASRPRALPRFCRSRVIRKYAQTVKNSQAMRKCRPLAHSRTAPCKAAARSTRRGPTARKPDDSWSDQYSLRIQTGRAAQHRQQGQKKRAQRVEPQMNGFRAQRKSGLPLPNPARQQNPHGGDKQRKRAGQCDRQPNARRTLGRQQPSHRPGERHQQPATRRHGRRLSGP